MPANISELFGESEVENLEEAVADRLGDKYIIVEEENFIPKNRFEEVRQEKESLEEQLDQTQEQLSELEKYAEEKEKLEEKVNEIQSEYEEFKEQAEQRRKEIQKRSQLEKELIASNVPEDAADLLVRDFDLEELELDEEGNLKNIEEHKEEVRKKRPSLFAEDHLAGVEPADGDSEDTVIDMDNIDNMTPEQINENWDKISEQMQKENQ